MHAFHETALPASILVFCTSLQAATKWIETESFASQGGWALDTQFIDIMRSLYLMAHGMGKAVKDAETEVEVPMSLSSFSLHRGRCSH